MKASVKPSVKPSVRVFFVQLPPRLPRHLSVEASMKTMKSSTLPWKLPSLPRKLPHFHGSFHGVHESFRGSDGSFHGRFHKLSPKMQIVQVARGGGRGGVLISSIAAVM